MIISFDITYKKDYLKIFIDPPISTVHCWWLSILCFILQVTCTGHFTRKFPIDELRHDVEVLIIKPYNACPTKPREFCGQENSLTMGRTYQSLRQLKTLRIIHSRIPNIGRKTLWGLSGLEILDLSHNQLSNVIEPNFDGLYSLRELYLNDNQIKSLVSAAFRHASRLQILSLAHNKLEGKETTVWITYMNQKFFIRLN